MAAPPGFNKVAVFCGSSSGTNPLYVECARSLGRELAQRKMGLVYGGGNVGLMGAVAEAVAEGPMGSGNVIGVIPTALAPREVCPDLHARACLSGSPGTRRCRPLRSTGTRSRVVPRRPQISGTTVGEIRMVDTMHTRKAMMAAEADAFVALPGGFGTLDELMEIVTWQQLGFHAKPIGLLNAGGFYDGLLTFLDHATAEGFIRPDSRGILVSGDSPAELLDKLAQYKGRWADTAWGLRVDVSALEVKLLAAADWGKFSLLLAAAPESVISRRQSAAESFP